MAVSAAQKEVPLKVVTGQTSIQFGIAVAPVSGDVTRPVAPDVRYQLMGIQSDLDESMARLRDARRFEARKAASSADSGVAEVGLEFLSTYLQSRAGAAAFAGHAINFGTMALEIYTTRRADRMQREARAEESAAITPKDEKLKSLATQWQQKDSLALTGAAAEEQAIKKLTVAEAADPNAKDLFGAQHQIDQRESNIVVRGRILPPGASSLDDAASDPDFVLKYESRTGQNPAFRIPGFG